MVVYRYLFFVFLMLVVTRINTAYLPYQLVRKTITVKNTKIAKLLIDPYDPLHHHVKNKPAYRNKMSFVGLILYILGLLTVIVCVVLLNAKPLGPADFSFDNRSLYMYVNTLNDALIGVSSFLFIYLSIFLQFINNLPAVIREKEPRGRKLLIVLYCFIALVSFTIFIFTLADLIKLIRLALQPV